MNSLKSLQIVADLFSRLNMPYAFLGGAVMPFLLDHPEKHELRETKDVDLTVQVATIIEVYRLEKQLRQLGFRHDTREDAPICRWIVKGAVVDIMPVETSVFGFSSTWFQAALESASEKTIGSDLIAPIVSPVCFLATKLDAFRDRGLKDLWVSKDLEDILTLVEGCDGLTDMIANSPPDIGNYIITQIAEHISNEDVAYTIEYSFRTDSESVHRLALVQDRLAKIASMRTIATSVKP